MDDVVKLFAVRAEEKGLKSSTLVEPNVPQDLVGDSGRRRQIMVNLIGNAVKFTGEGCVEMTVSLANEFDEDVMLCVRVRDTGIGISTEQTDRIFMPFTQADGPTTREYGGTGLGLAIVNQLVEAMGGTVDVESKESEGSTFSITARFARSIESEEPEPQRADISAIQENSVSASIYINPSN